MIPKTKLNEILDQLEALDQSQVNEVLTYIRSILYVPKNDYGNTIFKENAMDEIRRALRK